MAHHGTGHTRFNRVVRRKYQLESAYYSETGQMRENRHDKPATISPETVVAGLKNDLILGPEMQKQEVHDSQELLEKRQQSDTATGDQTMVSATVINVVDNNSQTSSGTSATAPTTISDESTVPVTTDLSTESDSFSLSLSATISIEVPLTASPAYSSPTADTPAVTSTPEPSSSVPPSSAPASSKTSTPLFGSTAPSLPSSTSIKPSSAVSGSNTSGTQDASQVTASSSGVAFGYSSQSTTTSSVSQTSSATTSVFSSESTSTDSYYGAWTTASNGGSGGLGGTATGQAASETSFSSGSSGSGSNSTSSSGSGSGSGSLSTQTKGKIAGGVVGGVAAAMFVFVFVVWLLRRRRKNILPPSGDALPEPDTTGTAEGSVPRSAEMASRRSSDDPLFTASYFAPAFMKRWRQSHMTTHTEDSTVSSEPSERGFQKISGRKIPSVLQSGGDGYGGGFEPGSPTASEPSTIFSPSSPVQPRSPATQPPLTTPYGMPLDASYTREAEESGGMVVFRPSPARTVTSTSASLSNEPGAPRIVSQVIVPGALSPTMPKRPDALGRSHPSFDGSRGSRFTESI